MTRILHLEINKCLDCPYNVYQEDGGGQWYDICNATELIIVDGDTIDEDCPLPLKEDLENERK